jgi:MFS family permease
MTGIAVAGLLLGFLADRFGRRRTIVAGLVLFAAACFLLSAGNTLWFFAILLALSGLAIGIFKTGALALIGDISTSTAEHTSIMNAAEGFFGAGAIVGPALLTWLLGAGLSWKWLYVIAGGMCSVLVVLALLVRYPETPRHAASGNSRGTGAALRNPYVLGFSAGAFLYVAVEAAIYVWMPTLLARYTGSACGTCGVQPLDLLPAPRRRAIPRRLGAAAGAVAGGADGLQRLHPGVLRVHRHWWRGVGRLPPAAVRAVHVGDVSDDQFEGASVVRTKPITAPRRA